MSQLKQRKKPLSTSTLKDKHSGLNYNYEDRLSKLKLFKTSILMSYLSIAIAYFSYETYKLVGTWIFDFYWYYIKDVRDAGNPHFLRDIYISNLIDFIIFIVKGVFAFYVFKYINTKLLLTYDDDDELEKYN